MDLDPLSIVTPARVKVLLLPVGLVRQSRFAGFVQRLQDVNVVRLGDVSPDSRPNRTAFSPLAFPEGLVLYDFSTSYPPASHIALAPFEIYREPLVIVGLADGVENALNDVEGGKVATSAREHPPKTTNMHSLRTLVRSLEDIIDEYPKALLHQILVFDHDVISMPERIFPVPALAKSKTTTIKTIMCDLTSRLLAEMALYSRSLQGLQSLDSPSNSLSAAANNGTASALPVRMTEASQNEGSRQSSPLGEGSKPDPRISTPTALHSISASGVSTPDSRPVSPPEGDRTLPGPFNEIAGSSTFRSPPRTSSRDRANGRNRIKGRNAGSLGEREKIKGRGRIGIVTGAMYLLAGRWPDAVKELVQGAGIARNSSDYIWHAKAMDYVLVCLLMYAWAGMDFRIPENFFPGTEKPGSSSSKSTKHAPSKSVPDLSVSKSVDPVARATSLRALTELIPDLAHNILNLYTRAWTYTEDKLPPLAYSQSVIRFVKLLSAISLSHGTLSDALLRHVVLNADLPTREQPPPEIVPRLNKGELIELLFRGYPAPPSEALMSVADHTTILAGIASVLSDLGYHRKKALVLKELMTGLLPALVQARKDGAAEMGVHPAASLASLHTSIQGSSSKAGNSTSNETERGMRSFLSLVCQSYGMTPLGIAQGEGIEQPKLQGRGPSKGSQPSGHARSAEITASRVLHHASARASSSQLLKIDILRSCINVCEALPDLGGALQFSAELLKIGGSGIAPGPDSSDGSPELLLEEQLRLVSNISRTLSAARQLGFEHPEAEYWDEFLVRDIQVLDASSARNLQSHAKLELELVGTVDTKQEKNPFIYNPFLKNRGSAVKESLLVAQEETLFRVTLQNLYDFDVTIEWAKVLAEGVSFECEAQSILIGPYRTQTIILSGTPLSPGVLAVWGCLVKVKGCQERAFPTFEEPWSLKADVKGRHVGLAGKTRPKSTASDRGKSRTQHTLKGPTPSALQLNVLRPQPNLTLKSISAPQAAVMLLEGELERFTVTLQNTSYVAPVDLLLVSFDDPTLPQRQSILHDKDLSATQLHETEFNLTHRQSFRLRRTEENRNLNIDAGSEITLEIEVLGKPGLSNGTIQVDYSHLGIPKSAIKDKFYTRQLMIPLTVTVSASINIRDSDIVALPSGLILQLQEPATTQIEKSSRNLPSSTPPDVVETDPKPVVSSPSGPNCLLLLDLHNSWSNALTIDLETSDPSTVASSHSPVTTHNHNIQSGTTHRMPISLPRFYISNPHAPIPSLNPANKRQFVVSASQNTPEAERSMREAFWYREALLERLKATWKEESTGRKGSVDLRTLNLSPSMLAALKLPDLEIGLSVVSAEPDATPPHSSTGPETIKKTEPSTYAVPLSTFLTLRTHLYNRSSLPISPLLRLQPTLANQPPHIALDLSKKLLVNGVTQRALPMLGPGERYTVETSFVVLNRGVYEWRASVEEITAVGKAREQGERKRAATGDLDVLGDMGRRTWLAEEPCIVDARPDNLEHGLDE